MVIMFYLFIYFISFHFFAAAEGIISGGLRIAYLVGFLETVFHLIDGCNLVIISAHSAFVQGDLKCK